NPHRPARGHRALHPARAPAAGPSVSGRGGAGHVHRPPPARARRDAVCGAAAVLPAALGPPLRGTFATLLATSDRDAIEQAMTLYRERFAEVGLFENEGYDGIPAALGELAPPGH